MARRDQVFAALASGDTLTVRELSVVTGLPRRTVSRALAALSERGLVDETYVEAGAGERGMYGLVAGWFAVGSRS